VRGKKSIFVCLRIVSPKRQPQKTLQKNIACVIVVEGLISNFPGWPVIVITFNYYCWCCEALDTEAGKTAVGD